MPITDTSTRRIFVKFIIKNEEVDVFLLVDGGAALCYYNNRERLNAIVLLQGRRPNERLAPQQSRRRGRP